METVNELVHQQPLKRTLSYLLFSLVTVALVDLFNNESWAAGKKPGAISCPITSPPPPPLFSTPFPVRNLRLAQIGTKAFQLPNGVLADLSVDLQTILGTAVTSTPVFAPSDPLTEDPCNSHLELRSAVTTFQLDVVEAGVSFGFSPAGSLNTVSSITAGAHVKVGMIAMDFSLWQCEGGSCFAVAAATSSQLTTGGNLTFEADFSLMKTGAALAFHPVLGPVLRAIMEDGMNQLASSSRVSELPWRTLVRDYNPNSGVLTLSRGAQSRLLPNQTFEVYAPTDTTAQGVCDVYETVAYVHTSAVNAVSSEAVVDQILNPRGVQKGDVVMVRAAAR